MTAFPPPTTAPAGWYPDPVGGGSRYFDGRMWQPVDQSAVAFEQRPPHPQLPVSAARGALVILLASLIVGRTLIELLVEYDWPVLVYVVILTLLGYGPSVAWAWYVRRRWAGGRLGEVGWKFRWGDLWRGPVTYLVAVGIEIVVALLVTLAHIPTSGNTDDVSDRGVDRVYVIAVVVTAVIAAPVVEELVFRGVVLRGLLSRLGPVPAIALQGLLFGMAHFDPVRGAGNIGLMIVLSSVGITFGAAAYLMRRIGPTVIAHAVLNGVVMVIVLTGVLDDVDRDLGAQLAIVDQAHVAEPGGDQQHVAGAGSADRLERVAVDHRHVFEPRPGLAGYRVGGQLDQRR
jgi:membrane protease YdiL (CAAX protease family)